MMTVSLSLSPRAAACLDTLRTGSSRKMQIAQQAALTFPQTRQGLAELELLGLATTEAGRRWALTPTGERAPTSVATAMRGRRGPRSHEARGGLGAGEARLLACLDRPRRGAELAGLLGVTRQRIHQLVIKLSARGVIRCALQTYPTFVVAAANDPS